MKDKFEEEKEHFEILLENYDSKYNSWKIIKPLQDPPDLIIEKENNFIAIEHTRLHINNKRPQEIEWVNLMKDCQKEVNEYGFSGYVIRIEPNGDNLLRKKRRSIVKSKILDLIQKYHERLGTEKSLVIPNSLPEVNTIKVFRRQTELSIINFGSRNYFTSDLKCSKKIKKIVETKSEKIKNIDFDQFNEIWLLIVLEGKIYSNSPELSNTKILSKKDNKFHRIFLLHLEEKWAQEIENNE